MSIPSNSIPNGQFQNEPGYSSDVFWHLTGEYGINIEGAWSRYSGEGGTIGFVDEGFDLSDADLSDNYDSSLSDNYAGSEVGGDQSSHGTRVAHYAIGAANGGGGIGVSYGADWAAFQISFSAGNLGPAITDAVTSVDIVNNSWNFSTSFSQGYAGSILQGINTGRDGLGTIIVFSAGNDREDDRSASTQTITNDVGTIVVGSIGNDGTYASTSSPGSSLLVSAPGAGTVWDYDPSTGSTSLGYGTSFAAPTVSGVVGLMLEANPDLGWRDVQEILAITSRQIDGSNSSWAENQAGNWNGGGMSFSNDYGFGLVDATAAVNLAEAWYRQNTSANMETSSVDFAPVSSLSTSSYTLNLTEDILLDQATLFVGASYGDWDNLAIELVSADGTVSRLLDGEAATGSYVGFEYETNAFWGETSAGSWIVNFRNADTGALVDVDLDFLELTAYGSLSPENDTYYLTSEFTSLVSSDPTRATIDDSDGGVDTINLAASRRSNQVDLSGQEQSVFEGVNFTLNNAATEFEHAVTGGGNDLLWGNSLANTFFTNSGNDRMYGYGGNDYFVTGYGADVVYGGDGDDRIVSQWGGDTIYGEDGNDRIMTASGEDFADGGAGDDLIFVGGDADTARGGAGHDHIFAGAGADDVNGDSGNDRIWGEGGADALDGGSGNDSLDGGDGDDVLNGGIGNDRLNGQAGSDAMSGGTGDDTYILHQETDTVTELQGEGFDRVFIHGLGDYNTSSEVEYVRVFDAAGAANVQLNTDVRTSLFGNASANTLQAGSGNDFLDGGAGDDRLAGGAGVDVFIFTDLSGSVDTIEDFEDGVDHLGVEGLLTSSALLDATANGVLSQGHVVAIQDGSNVDLYINSASYAGSGGGNVEFATLENTLVSEMTDDDFAFI